MTLVLLSDPLGIQLRLYYCLFIYRLRIHIDGNKKAAYGIIPNRHSNAKMPSSFVSPFRYVRKALYAPFRSSLRSHYCRKERGGSRLVLLTSLPAVGRLLVTNSSNIYFLFSFIKHSAFKIQNSSLLVTQNTASSLRLYYCLFHILLTHSY